jgi:hypothetical protein
MMWCASCIYTGKQYLILHCQRFFFFGFVVSCLRFSNVYATDPLDCAYYGGVFCMKMVILLLLLLLLFSLVMKYAAIS